MYSDVSYMKYNTDVAVGLRGLYRTNLPEQCFNSFGTVYFLVLALALWFECPSTVAKATCCKYRA